MVVSPEYNHSVPPALSGLMGAFGSSNYLYKPAATVTYSPSPWGGMRCAPDPYLYRTPPYTHAHVPRPELLSMSVLPPQDM